MPHRDVNWAGRRQDRALLTLHHVNRHVFLPALSLLLAISPLSLITFLYAERTLSLGLSFPVPSLALQYIFE